MLVFLFSLLARVGSNKRTNRASLLFVIIVTGILVLVSGLRSNVGDTEMYMHTYEILTPDFSGGDSYEPGFILFLKMLKEINTNPQFMIFITALITNVCIILTLWKYSDKYYFEISTFLYISTGYILVTMNGIRQCLAAAIIFSLTPLLIKRKWKIYIPLIILCCTLHSSAFIMIPIYFIVNMKPWSKNSIVLVVCTILAMLLYSPLMNMASSILGGKIADYNKSTEGGANLIRVAVYFVPTILAYMKRKELDVGWQRINIFVNITLLSSLIMLFSSINWVFSRFTLYLEPYTFILMGYMIKNCFYGKEKRLLYFGIILCYTIFFFVECPSNLNGVPYKTNFNFNEFIYY